MVLAWQGCIGRWSPGIGDPTFMGWVTVFAYFATCWAAWRLARRLKPQRPGLYEWRFWQLCAVVLLGLGINKQLDLQSAFTEVGRLVARAQGWYELRRFVQLAFIVFSVLIAGLLWLVLSLMLRQAPRATRLAMLGLTMIGAFVLVRASSFHHVDEMLDAGWLGFELNWLLELGGIFTVATGCFFRRRQAQGARVR